MKHALVVGGTGMLAQVSLWLSEQGYHVSVIARNSAKMEALLSKAANPSKFTPVLVDYRNDQDLKEKIGEVYKKKGDVDLVVAWIHSSAENALHIINNEIFRTSKQWDLYHVVGSSTDLEKLRQEIKVDDHCHYHQVKLGFILENDHSRWLTHTEISSGVIDALKRNKAESVVGVIEPWKRRP